MVTHPLSRDELVSSLAPFTRTTTADGNVAGTTLIDHSLHGSPDFLTQPLPKAIQILSGPAQWQISPIIAFDNGLDQITVGLAFSAQILAGTIYRPLNSASGGGAEGSPLIFPNGISVPAAGSLTIPNAALVIGDINVGAAGSLTIEGNCQCTGSLNNAGPVSVLGDLDVTVGVSNSALLLVYGKTYIGGILTVSGTSILRGGLKVGQNIIINGASYFDVYGDCSCYAFTNSSTCGCTIDGDFTCASGLINSGLGQISILGDVRIAVDWNNTGGGTIFINGKTFINGSLIIDGIADVACGPLQVGGALSSSSASPIEINGNCQIGEHIANSGGGTLKIHGKLDINGDEGVGEGYFNNTGGGNITITGDTYIAGILTNPSATIITGQLKVQGDITNGGTLTAQGGILLVGTLTNTGTINNNTYHYP